MLWPCRGKTLSNCLTWKKIIYKFETLEAKSASTHSSRKLEELQGGGGGRRPSDEAGAGTCFLQLHPIYLFSSVTRLLKVQLTAHLKYGALMNKEEVLMVSEKGGGCRCNLLLMAPESPETPDLRLEPRVSQHTAPSSQIPLSCCTT